MSKHTEPPAPKGRSSRVIKSHHLTDVRFAFPALDPVVADSFVPAGAEVVTPVPAPSRSEGQGQFPAQPPAQAHTHAPAHSHGGTRSHSHQRAEMPDAEVRAMALERRAALVLAEAEEVAGQRVADAEKRAAALVAEAQAEAGQIRDAAEQAGREAGRAEGYQQGLNAARAEAEGLLAQVRAEAETELAEARAMAESMRRDAQAERAELLDATWSQVLDLAFAMARQVLKAELTLRPEAMLPMLGVALAKLKGEEEPQVRVTPELLALLEEHRGRLLAALPGARRVVLEADHSLESGDFVVQGDQGYVDGRLERQLQVIESELKAGER